MSDLPRTFPVFSAVFCAVYLAAVEQNWALFTYHPRLGAWAWLTDQPRTGPPMYWYGWLATAFLAAAAASLLALPLVRRRPLPDWIGWTVPLAVMAAFLYFLRGFFLR